LLPSGHGNQSVTNGIARSIGYGTTAALIALVFLSGDAAYLFRVEETSQGMAELGYPAYFVTILGMWKVLGGVAILAPRRATPQPRRCFRDRLPAAMGFPRSFFPLGQQDPGNLLGFWSSVPQGCGRSVRSRRLETTHESVAAHLECDCGIGGSRDRSIGVRG
jgi:hypothetical protein